MISTDVHIPHPAAKHRVQASLVHITKYWQSENGTHRVIVRFITNSRTPTWQKRTNEGVEADAKKILFDREANIGLYMSQNGRMSALWMNDQFWKVTQRRWKKNKNGIMRMKIEIEPVETSTSHEKSLKKAVSKFI